MPSDPDLLILAHSVLCKIRDSARDSRGTPAEKVSQPTPNLGTAKTVEHQGDKLGVPLSEVLGRKTAGQHEKPGTALGTVAGQSPYSATVAALESECPAAVETERWRQAIADAAAFLATWGTQAQAFSWTARELFGLHTTPERPAANYSRLSRYDETGLIWLLRGRPVIILTATEAVMRCHSGATLTYRRQNKPAAGGMTNAVVQLANNASSLTEPALGPVNG
jgi:hypothetical protein